MKARNGEETWLEVHLQRARVGGKDRLLAVMRDISPRKCAEHALRQSEERYRTIVETTHDIVWTLDSQGNFTFVNPRGEALTGYRLADWVGKSFAPLIVPEDLPKAIDAFTRTMAGKSVNYEVRVVDAETRVRDLVVNLEPLREDGNVVGVVGLGRDITEEKRLEVELHKAQKLESLGLLAGGIAHDFNNILTTVVGGIAVARRCMGEPEGQKQVLDMAERACMRARDLTRQLLTFSRGGAPVKTTVRIEELIRETAEFALRGSNLTLGVVIDDDLWPVRVDVGQIGQVLDNLLINARQAMTQGGSATLRASSS